MGGSLEFGLATPVPRASVQWGSASSIGLHLALIGALLLSPLRPMNVPPPVPVTVEIVTAEQFAALQPAAEAPPPIAIPTPEANSTAAPGPDEARLAPLESPAPGRPADRTYTATRFYSAAMLREPGMARIRRSLAGFADSERVVQLCNIEGLEQIRRAIPGVAPDTLVGYAMADPVLSGLTLSAAGGAFRSRRKWYGIAYSCTVAPDFRGVTAFAFTPGAAIPEAEWEAHNLNAADEDE